MKKISSIIFFAGALLMLTGAIVSGSLFSDKGSVAATYGNFIGTLLPILLYVLSGIFILTLDKPTKMSYIDGFRKKSKQASSLIIFIVAFFVLLVFAGIGVGMSDTDNFILSFIVTAVPYIVSLTILIALYMIEMAPHNATKKHFIKTDADLNNYLSTSETFYSYSGDNFVLASKKALFFPKLLCVVPFSQLSSISLSKELGLQYVYFNLSNGKKFYITSKHFDCIQNAINANK